MPETLAFDLTIPRDPFCWLNFVISDDDELEPFVLAPGEGHGEAATAWDNIDFEFREVNRAMIMVGPGESDLLLPGVELRDMEYSVWCDGWLVGYYTDREVVRREAHRIVDGGGCLVVIAPYGCQVEWDDEFDMAPSV